MMDLTLHSSAMDSVEGPIYFLSLLVTVFTINPYFIIPGVIELFVLYKYFFWNKVIITGAKLLDLQTKTPVFSFLTATI